MSVTMYCCRLFLMLASLAVAFTASGDALDDAREANAQTRERALGILVESCIQVMERESDPEVKLAMLQQVEPLRHRRVVPDHPGFATAVRRYNATCVSADTELIQAIESAYERATEALDLDLAELLKAELDVVRGRIDSTQPRPRGVQRLMDRLREHEGRYLDRATREEEQMLADVTDIVRTLAQAEDLQAARDVKAQLDAYLADGVPMRHAELGAIAERYNTVLDREAQALIRQYRSAIEQLQRLDRPAETDALQGRLASLTEYVPLPALLPHAPALYFAFDGDAQADDEERPAVLDEMGHDQRAVLFGGSALVESGMRGGALRTRGEGQFARVEGSRRLTLPPRRFTVMAFVNPSRNRGRQDIISHDDWANRGTRGFTLRLHDMQPDLTIGSNGWRTVGAGEPITTNRWVHLAASFDGEKLRLYLDGELVNEQDFRGSVERCGYHMQFGNCEFSPDRQFFGGIDEVMLFDTVLSNQDIRETHQLLMYPVTIPPTSASMTISPRLPRLELVLPESE